MSFETIIQACRVRGIDAVAITDHNVIDGALAFREIAPFPVIVGEEIKTTAGEIMGFFLEEWIPPHLSPEETVARIRAQGGLIGVSHPCDRVRRSVLKKGAFQHILPELDVIEVFNSRVLFPGDNERARKLALEHGLLQVAGSDAHTRYEVGRAYVEMKPFSDGEEFKNNLANGRIVGRVTNPLIHILTTWAKVRKWLR